MVEIPQGAVGGIVEDQALAHVEHRHGGGQLVEGASVGIHLLLEIGAHALQFRDIHRHADPAAFEGGFVHVEDATLAGHHRRNARCPARPAGGQHRFLAGDGLPCRAVEEFEPGIDHRFPARRFHGGDVGRVHPGEAAVAVAAPNRLRDRVEEACQGGKAAPRLIQCDAQFGDLAPLGRRLAQAQQSPAGHGAPLRVDVASPLGAEVQGEAGAAGEKRIEGGLHRLRVGGQKPRAEGEHPSGGIHGGPVAVQGDADITLDHRFAVLVPGDVDLTVGVQQHLGAVMGAPQEVEGRDEFLLPPGPARALIEIEKGHDHREGDEPAEDREAGDAVHLPGRVARRDVLHFRQGRARREQRENPHADPQLRRTSDPHPPCPQSSRHRRRAPVRCETHPAAEAQTGLPRYALSLSRGHLTVREIPAGRRTKRGFGRGG